jgi:hypothetical protein
MIVKVWDAPSLNFYCSASCFFICHGERVQQFVAHFASAVPLFDRCDGFNTSQAPGSAALENNTVKAWFNYSASLESRLFEQDT